MKLVWSGNTTRRSVKLRSGRKLTVLWRAMISTVLALMLASQSPTASTPASAASDSVTVAADKLDSLFAGVDSLLLERRLLQIDLRECRDKSRLDSTLYAERIKLRDEKNNLFVRIMRSKEMDLVFFIVGVYIGVQAGSTK